MIIPIKQLKSGCFFYAIHTQTKPGGFGETAGQKNTNDEKKNIYFIREYMSIAS